MAEGCEPAFVTKFMKAWQPYVHGWSLAGAGGGGFMVLLTREPNATDTLKKVLAEKTEQNVEVRMHSESAAAASADMLPSLATYPHNLGVSF
jgi:hypothetical protein